MRFKIKDTWYEYGPDQPIMLELTKEEKEVISNMPEKAYKMALCPEDWDQEKRNSFMDEGSLAPETLENAEKR